MIAIAKAQAAYGELGNMSPHAVVYQSKRYKTAEALFQALRFEDDGIREEIRTASSPMIAKMIAKRHKAEMVIVQQSDQDLDNMRLVLRPQGGAKPGGQADSPGDQGRGDRRGLYQSQPRIGPILGQGPGQRPMAGRKLAR